MASLRRASSGHLSVARSAVAIIVPARNEATNIGECLGGLAAQRGLAAGLAITVVDDTSQDRTADEVRRKAHNDARISLLDAGPLPPGWMGNPLACWRGAAAAGADWLCFVDADVRAEPELIAVAVQTAEHDGIDMLSLAPFQQLVSFWERLIVPA